VTRSWLTFGFGVLLLVSPLRHLWARPGAHALSIFAIWLLLVVAGAWLTRERRS
jgi:hypothetical protein